MYYCGEAELMDLMVEKTQHFGKQAALIVVCESFFDYTAVFRAVLSPMLHNRFNKFIL